MSVKWNNHYKKTSCDKYIVHKIKVTLCISHVPGTSAGRYLRYFTAFPYFSLQRIWELSLLFWNKKSHSKYQRTDDFNFGFTSWRQKVPSRNIFLKFLCILIRWFELAIPVAGCFHEILTAFSVFRNFSVFYCFPTFEWKFLTGSSSLLINL